MTDRQPRRYKQVARAQAQERTRDALLDAADEEFYEGHWPKASLEALAKRAGVTKQTLLRHFGSKEGLMLHMLVRGATKVHDQRWSTPTNDVAGAIENLLDHYEEWGERSLRIGAWLDSGSSLLAMFSRAAREVHYNWVEYAFGPWLEHLKGRARARRRAALIALCDVQTWWLFSHDLSLERSEIRAILVDLIERLLAEDPPR
ncbi:MAG: TetR/AcrR family transcriptional regulator [Solirubrobacteraceae bacterium]